MTTDFPGTGLDDFTNPASTDPLNNPDHATQHANKNDAIEAMQAKIGVDSSAVTTSHDFKLQNVTGSDKAASVTGSETLTNKTLTTPKIDTINEETPANGVTIDSLNIKDGKLTTADSVDSANYTDSSIDGEHLSTSTIIIGYAEATSNQGSITTEADLTSVTTTVTVPAGGRDVRVTGYVHVFTSVNDDIAKVRIYKDAGQINAADTCLLNTTSASTHVAIARDSAPTAGSITYKLTLARTAGSGNLTSAASATQAAFILVELI